jgi:thioredoxin-related protein
MRKAILPLLAVFFSFYIAGPAIGQEKEKSVPKGDKIKWYSFEEAYQLNKKKPKKIFIDVYTDWCGWCRKMDAETFTNPVIVAYMSKKYYCVKLDAERKDTVVIDGSTFVNPNPAGRRSTHQLANELLKGQMSYPSYVFLNEKSQWLTVVAGYQQAKEFESVIHYFGDDAYLKTAWGEYKDGFTGTIK